MLLRHTDGYLKMRDMSEHILKLLNSVIFGLAPKPRMNLSARLELAGIFLSQLLLGAVGMEHCGRHTHAGCWYSGLMATCRYFGTPY